MWLRSEAPARVFEPERLGLRLSVAPIDPGLRQHNALDIDRGASLQAHESFVADWQARVDGEAEWLGRIGASLVVGDVPPLAFAAAARAGLPSLSVANFSWDWILEPFGRDEPRWRPIVERYRAAYARATRLLRLPLHGEMSAFREIVDVPLLVNRARDTRERCRAALGLPPEERRRLVLLSFGGLGGFDDGPDPAEDLSSYRLLRDAASLRLPHHEVVCAADAVIGKPGYSTVAEALAHGTRYLYLPRPEFREVGPLLEGLERLGCAAEIPRSDFERGRWRAALDALFSRPAPAPPPRSDGAEAVAQHVLEALYSR